LASSSLKLSLMTLVVLVMRVSSSFVVSLGLIAEFNNPSRINLSLVWTAYSCLKMSLKSDQSSLTFSSVFQLTIDDNHSRARFQRELAKWWYVWASVHQFVLARSSSHWMKSAAEMVSLLLAPKNSGILFCSTLRLKFVGPLAPAPSPAAVPAAHRTVTQAVESLVSSSFPLGLRSSCSSSEPLFLGARLMSSFLVVVILCFETKLYIFLFGLLVVRRFPRGLVSFCEHHFFCERRLLLSFFCMAF
jgi:hypothetical protein